MNTQIQSDQIEENSKVKRKKALPFEKMFEKETNFGDLRFGTKATIFERDPKVIMHKKRG